MKRAHGPLQRALIGGTLGKGYFLYIPVQVTASFVEDLLWKAHTEGPFVGAL